MWSFSIYDQEYLVNITFVKTQSFGPQWQPHQIYIHILLLPWLTKLRQYGNPRLFSYARARTLNL